MPSLQLCVSVRMEGRLAVVQGRPVTVPVPVNWRNDADVLNQILGACDTAKDRFRDRRRLIRALQRALSPIVKKASAVDSECEDEPMGELEVSEDGLQFLGKLFADPPEGFELRGVTTATALLVEDALDELKEKEKEKDGPPKAT